MAVCVKPGETNTMLYAWGKGDSGQLGLGDREDRLVPSEVALPIPSKITSLAAGYFHSALTLLPADISEGLRVYTWGWGEHGQLGHGGVEDEVLPRAIVALQNVKVAKVSCGGAHTMVITQDFACYAFGNNEFGQLGVATSGPVSGEKPKTETLKLDKLDLGSSGDVKINGGSQICSLPVLLRVEGHGIISISCGWWRTVAIVQSTAPPPANNSNAYNINNNTEEEVQQEGGAEEGRAPEAIAEGVTMEEGTSGTEESQVFSDIEEDNEPPVSPTMQKNVGLLSRIRDVFTNTSPTEKEKVMSIFFLLNKKKENRNDIKR